MAKKQNKIYQNTTGETLFIQAGNNRIECVPGGQIEVPAKLDEYVNKDYFKEVTGGQQDG